MLGLDDIAKSITEDEVSIAETRNSEIESEDDTDLNDERSEENIDDDLRSENEDESNEMEQESTGKATYQPTEGEDIYGRIISNNSQQKYTPPAKRKDLSSIDEVELLY